MLSAPPGINAMRHAEQSLEVLAETSMTANQKITLLATIDMRFAASQLATGAFPRLAEVFRNGRIEPHKGRFDQGLMALLDQYRGK
jgi:hypothetical protein